MMEELRELAEEAKAVGLAVVVWSYPRGGKLDKEGETALDICAYAAHMAALIGAHIIKVKPPTDALSASRPRRRPTRRPRSTDRRWPRASSTSCRPASTAGASSCSRAARRRTPRACSKEVRAIRAGGGNGSIIGRNTFQRPKAEALKLLSDIIGIYQG